MKVLSPALAAFLLFTASARAQTPAPVAPATAKAPQAPDVAAEKRGKDGRISAGFIASHEKFVGIAKEGKAQLVFLGDSITAGWEVAGKEVWDKSFAQYTPVNFGIGGDRTQHLLWRLENGELETIRPKAVVLMIGTNNSGFDDAEGIARGVTKIVETIRAKQPQAKILLLAIFPRSEQPSTADKVYPGRAKLNVVNGILAKLDDGDHVHFLDIGERFLRPDGSLSKEIMPDYLHLSAAGYQIWADAIGPKLAELMR